jgi:inner membrane protein
MDNLTHSLAAALVAELVLAVRPTPNRSSRFRTLVFTTSIAANNVADLDFLYGRITPGKLGYLLHHRGHTHTLLVAAAISLVTLGCGATLHLQRVSEIRNTRLRSSRRDKWRLATVALVGPFLHIAMDYQNNYGVHPFWPIADGWYYGDAVFIVEPLLWAAVVPPLVGCAKTLGGRLLLGLPLALGFALAVTHRASSPGAAVAFAAVAVLSGMAARRGTVGRRLLVASIGWLSITAAFVVCGAIASARVKAVYKEHFPTTRVVDWVRTPAPANPLCWSFIVVGREAERYVARKATVSLAPALLPVDRCPAFDGDAGTAPLEPLLARGGGVRFRAEFSRPLAELGVLSQSDCDARAFLRFARAPFWTSERPRVIGDLRFDRSPKLEFAEIRLEDGPCPPHVPPWAPPRTDLLDASRVDPGTK